jgi:predicted RNase H-like nuclease
VKELLRTTDLVRLSFLEALLTDAGVRAIVLDAHMSVMEGSIFAIPRRLVVAEEDYGTAMRVLREAGEAPTDA